MYKVIEEKDDKGKVWYVVAGERFPNKELAQKKQMNLINVINLFDKWKYN